MEIQTAYQIVGILVLAGVMVVDGIIYSGLEKIVKAIEKQK